jgi:Ca-activated chloride channel family protein
MSQNQIQPDDPRLTAYALGELDPTEQESLEQLLFDSPEAQAAVREIRELAGLLATELRQEPVSGLTAAQRNAILVASPVASPVADPAANRPSAEWAHEQADNVTDQSNDVALQLGLPDPPVPLSSRLSKHRSSNQSVIRFASLATIAALVVVVAVMLPPSRPQGDFPLQMLSEGRYSEPEALDLQFDFALQQRVVGHSPDVTTLSPSPSLMSDRLAEFDETAPTREYAKSSDSAFSPDGRSPAIAGGGTAATGRQRFKSGSEPAQVIARNENERASGGGRSSTATAKSTPMSTVLGRGLASSDNTPNRPRSTKDQFGDQNRAAQATSRLQGLQSQRGRGVDPLQTGSLQTGLSKEAKGVAYDQFGTDQRSNRNLAVPGVAQTGPVPVRVPMAGVQPADAKSKALAGKPLAQLQKPAATAGERPGLSEAKFNYAETAGEAEVALQEAQVEDLQEQLVRKAGNGSQPYFAWKINTYNKLLKETRFDDAIEIGEQVVAQQPQNPVSSLMVLKAKVAKEQSVNGKLDGEVANAYTKQLTDLETAGLGTIETEGIEYPTFEKGRVLAERRKLWSHGEVPGTEGYEPIVENPFVSAYQDPLSTFGVDVDTASYANVRRFLTDQQLPPPNAVRIEELVNYFSYDYAPPAAGQPFSVNVEAANCAWNPGHQLVRIALKGREIPRDQRPASNLVFLVDVSGSMQAENKLPLVKLGLNLLTKQMTESDQVAIVTYSDSAVQRLESTNGTNRQQILAVIDSLQAAGSTNGAEGIQLAYRAALGHFIDGGTNRVILCTDGDFNVGVSDDDGLVKLIQERARTKVFFSVFGFGMGNLKDGKLEKLADKGNGHYAYIDGQREAHKMFVDELVGTLVTIAKDVKLQVEFNPNQVGAYRLIGYENRVMASQDFNNDKKDAGEIGAGHTVTALYEIIPADAAPKPELGDSLRYRKAVVPQEGEVARELLTVKVRYKLPEADTSTLLEVPALSPVIAEVLPESRGAYALDLHRLKADPAAASLRSLFGEIPDSPVIEADAANGRLMIRGSARHISQIRQLLRDMGETRASASSDFNWAAAVAAFGMILRDSRFRAQANFDMVLELAQGAKGEDKSGQRAEFIALVKTAKALCQPETTSAPSVEPTPTLKLTREQAEAQANVNGKYHNLLRIVPAAKDAAGYGSFRDFGRWEGTSYQSHDNLPPGYWVYVAPNWYIWGDAR